MSFILKLNWLLTAYLAPLKNIFRWKLWAPFFIYGLLQLFLLLILKSYVYPFTYMFLSPLVALLGQGREIYFSHYPGLYILLPEIFQWGKLLLGIVAEGLFAGMTAILFLKVYSSGKGKSLQTSEAVSRWPSLIIIWGAITIILLLINWALPSLFRSLLAGSPRRIALFEILLRLFTVFVYGIFIYALPAMIIFRKSIWGALQTSFGYFAKYPIFSFFLALLPYLLSLPVSYSMAEVDTIVEKFSPELVFYILLAGIAIDMLINFLTTGAVVRFLLDQE
ncbi:MAG: hypothetical protein HRF51_10950 [bacterium]